MEIIHKIKSISIWIFIIPFLAVNACLVITTQFHDIIEPEFRIFSVFPYIDGGVSISRTARYFPTYLIFKPAMFLTSYLLIKYWIYNKNLISKINIDHKHLKKIIFFGIGSAVALALHSIFLGIKLDNDLYKFLRRFVMITFIVFEIIAQTYLVIIYYSIQNKIQKFINKKILYLKILLVTILIVVAILSIPLIALPGNKFLKHALEWDYFIGVITFYLLTFLMWKKN